MDRSSWFQGLIKQHEVGPRSVLEPLLFICYCEAKLLYLCFCPPVTGSYVLSKADMSQMLVSHMICRLKLIQNNMIRGWKLVIVYLQALVPPYLLLFLAIFELSLGIIYSCFQKFLLRLNHQKLTFGLCIGRAITVSRSFLFTGQAMQRELNLSCAVRSSL